MFILKNSRIVLLIGLLVLILMSSCSTSKQLKYERGQSEYSYNRIKKGTYEDPKENEFLELTSSVSNRPEAGKRSKASISDTSRKKTSSSKKKNAQETEEEVLRDEIYETASQYLGIGYRSGGRAPNTGFDCSGFVNYVYHTMGIPVSGTSVSLSKVGILKPNEELKRGDLVFFGRNGNIHHVGIVSANDNGEIEMIHSSSSNGITIDVIQKTNYWKKRFMYGKDVITEYLKNKESKSGN